jgi:amidase
VEVLEIKTEKSGVIVTIPRHGILTRRRFKSFTGIVEIGEKGIDFCDGVRFGLKLMIGTIRVTLEAGEIPAGSLGRHGGNMDVKDMTAGTKLYFPVFTEGALFAAGDLHAVQADGELCVSAVEVAGEILVKFNIIKDRRPEWPILETEDRYALLACGKTLDEASRFAAEAAVKALMRQHNCSFEEAYMLGSLAVNLEINQVVDPKKGVRAAISKALINLNSLLSSSRYSCSTGI